MKTYNWEGVNPDGYFLDKLETIPSGLTPSQLYVFMPPNLGDRKSGSAGMPRPISYAVFCLKKKNIFAMQVAPPTEIAMISTKTTPAHVAATCTSLTPEAPGTT